MNKENVNVIFDVLAGSFMYGLNVSTSDEDHRGIFLPTMKELLALNEPPEQVNDLKNDMVYYSLKRFFVLAQTANPNIIELLWCPEDCIVVKKPQMDILIENKCLFITKKAYFSHAAYAVAQIAKARGCNKRVNNPKPKEQPTIEQFCWVVKFENHYPDNEYDFDPTLFKFGTNMPMRPVGLKESFMDLSDYNCTSMEHVENTYRLYYYGEDKDKDKRKGVFHGNQIVTQSIPFDDEVTHFAGILVYNENAYNKEFKEWQQYWEWMKKRNNARWVDQEKGNLDYDQKNMMHCLRLLHSCENILRNGEPIVRCTGELRDFLMNVRMGKFNYDYLMSLVKEKELVLKELYEKSTLPENADYDRLNEVYKEVVEMFDKFYFAP